MHVFLFDIDGTLINSRGAGQAALHQAMASEFGIDAPKEVVIHGQTDRCIASDLFHKHEIEDSEHNWNRFCAAYLYRLPASLASRSGSVLPGVQSLLDDLARRDDVATGLLTGNVAVGARIKLEHFHLHKHFAFGGFGDQHRQRDDVARDALAAARQRFDGQVSPEKTIVIGDTPNDIRCARHIRARVVAVATGFYSYQQLAVDQPDVLLADLADPTDILALLD